MFSIRVNIDSSEVKTMSGEVNKLVSQVSQLAQKSRSINPDSPKSNQAFGSIINQMEKLQDGKLSAKNANDRVQSIERAILGLEKGYQYLGSLGGEVGEFKNSLSGLKDLLRSTVSGKGNYSNTEFSRASGSEAVFKELIRSLDKTDKLNGRLGGRTIPTPGDQIGNLPDQGSSRNTFIGYKDGKPIGSAGKTKDNSKEVEAEVKKAEEALNDRVTSYQDQVKTQVVANLDQLLPKKKYVRPSAISIPETEKLLEVFDNKTKKDNGLFPSSLMQGEKEVRPQIRTAKNGKTRNRRSYESLLEEQIEKEEEVLAQLLEEEKLEVSSKINHIKGELQGVKVRQVKDEVIHKPEYKAAPDSLMRDNPAFRDFQENSGDKSSLLEMPLNEYGMRVDTNNQGQQGKSDEQIRDTIKQNNQIFNEQKKKHDDQVLANQKRRQERMATAMDMVSSVDTGALKFQGTEGKRAIKNKADLAFARSDVMDSLEALNPDMFNGEDEKQFDGKDFKAKFQKIVGDGLKITGQKRERGSKIQKATPEDFISTSTQVGKLIAEQLGESDQEIVNQYTRLVAKVLNDGVSDRKMIAAPKRAKLDRSPETQALMGRLRADRLRKAAAIEQEQQRVAAEKESKLREGIPSAPKPVNIQDFSSIKPKQLTTEQKNSNIEKANQSFDRRPSFGSLADIVDRPLDKAAKAVNSYVKEVEKVSVEIGHRHEEAHKVIAQQAEASRQKRKANPQAQRVVEKFVENREENFSRFDAGTGRLSKEEMGERGLRRDEGDDVRPVTSSKDMNPFSAKQLPKGQISKEESEFYAGFNKQLAQHKKEINNRIDAINENNKITSKNRAIELGRLTGEKQELKPVPEVSTPYPSKPNKQGQQMYRPAEDAGDKFMVGGQKLRRESTEIEHQAMRDFYADQKKEEKKPAVVKVEVEVHKENHVEKTPAKTEKEPTIVTKAPVSNKPINTEVKAPTPAAQPIIIKTEPTKVVENVTTKLKQQEEGEKGTKKLDDSSIPQLIKSILDLTAEVRLLTLAIHGCDKGKMGYETPSMGFSAPSTKTQMGFRMESPMGQGQSPLDISSAQINGINQAIENGFMGVRMSMEGNSGEEGRKMGFDAVNPIVAQNSAAPDYPINEPDQPNRLEEVDPWAGSVTSAEELSNSMEKLAALEELGKQNQEEKASMPPDNGMSKSGSSWRQSQIEEMLRDKQRQADSVLNPMSDPTVGNPKIIPNPSGYVPKEGDTRTYQMRLDNLSKFLGMTADTIKTMGQVSATAEERIRREGKELGIENFSEHVSDLFKVSRKKFEDNRLRLSEQIKGIETYSGSEVNNDAFIKSLSSVQKVASRLGPIEKESSPEVRSAVIAGENIGLKGADLMRMIDNAVDEGVRAYKKRFGEKQEPKLNPNAKPEDILKSLMKSVQISMLKLGVRVEEDILKIKQISAGLNLPSVSTDIENLLNVAKKKHQEQRRETQRQARQIDNLEVTTGDQTSFTKQLGTVKSLTSKLGGDADLTEAKDRAIELGINLGMSIEKISLMLNREIEKGMKSFNSAGGGIENTDLEAAKQKIQSEILKLTTKLNDFLSGTNNELLGKFEKLETPKPNKNLRSMIEGIEDTDGELLKIVQSYENWEKGKIRAAQTNAFNAAKDDKRATGNTDGLNKIIDTGGRENIGRLDLVNKSKGELNRVFGEQLRQSMQEVFYLTNNVQNMFRTISSAIKEITLSAGRQEKEDVRSNVANAGDRFATAFDKEQAKKQSIKYGGAAIDTQSNITDFKASNPQSFSAGGDKLDSKYSDSFASDMVEALSAAANVNQLTNEETKRLITSAKQMQSIGTINAEELKQQMAGVLSGAPAIMAKSLGITMNEMQRRQKRGEVSSDDALPLFAAALKRQFGKGASEENLSKKARVLEGNVTDLKIKTSEIAAVPAGIAMDISNAFLKAFGDAAKLIALGIVAIAAPIVIIAISSSRQIMSQMLASSNTALRAGIGVAGKLALPVGLMAGAAIAGQASQALGGGSIDTRIQEAGSNLVTGFVRLLERTMELTRFFGLLGGAKKDDPYDKKGNEVVKALAEITALTVSFMALRQLVSGSFEASGVVMKAFTGMDNPNGVSTSANKKDHLKEFDEMVNQSVLNLEAEGKDVKKKSLGMRGKLTSALQDAFSGLGALAGAFGVSIALAIATVILANSTFKTKGTESVQKAADLAKDSIPVPKKVIEDKEFTKEKALSQFKERGKTDANFLSVNGIQSTFSDAFKSDEDASDNGLAVSLNEAIEKQDNTKDKGEKERQQKIINKLVSIAKARKNDTRAKTSSGTTEDVQLQQTQANNELLTNTETASKGAMEQIDAGVIDKAKEVNLIVEKLSQRYQDAVKSGKSDEELDVITSQLTNAKKKVNDALLPFKESIQTIMSGIEALEGQKKTAIADQPTEQGKIAVEAQYNAAIAQEKSRLIQQRKQSALYDPAEILDKEQSQLKRKSAKVTRQESDDSIASDKKETQIIKLRRTQGDDLKMNEAKALLEMSNATAKEKVAKNKLEIAGIQVAIAKKSGDIDKIEKAAEEQGKAEAALAGATKSVAESLLKKQQVIEANTLALFDRAETKAATKASRNISIETNKGYVGFDQRQGADQDQKVANNLDKMGYEKLQASYEAYKLIAPKLKLNKEEVALKLETMRVDALNAKDGAAFAKKKRDIDQAIRKETERITDFGREENRKDTRLQSKVGDIKFQSDSSIVKNSANDLQRLEGSYRVANFEAGRAADKVKQMAKLIETIKQPEVKADKILELGQAQLNLEQKKQAMEIAHFERVRAVLAQGLEDVSRRAKGLVDINQGDRDFKNNSQRNNTARLEGKTNYYGESSSENLAGMDVKQKDESLRMSLSQAKGTVDNAIGGLNIVSEKYFQAGVKFDPNRITNAVGRNTLDRLAQPDPTGKRGVDPGSLKRIQGEITAGYSDAKPDETGNRTFKRAGKTITMNQEEYDQTQTFIETLLVSAQTVSNDVLDASKARNAYNAILKRNKAVANQYKKDVTEANATYVDAQKQADADLQSAFDALAAEVAGSQLTGGANTSVNAIDQVTTKAASSEQSRQTARNTYDRASQNANETFERKSQNASPGEIDVARAERDKALNAAEISMNTAIKGLSAGSAKELVSATRTARVELKTIRNQYTGFALEIEGILKQGDELLAKYGESRQYTKYKGSFDKNKKYSLDSGSKVDTSDTVAIGVREVEDSVTSYNDSIDKIAETLGNADPMKLQGALERAGRMLMMDDSQIQALQDSVKDVDINSKEVTALVSRLREGLTDKKIGSDQLNSMKRNQYNRGMKSFQDSDDDQTVQRLEQVDTKESKGYLGLIFANYQNEADDRSIEIYKTKRAKMVRDFDRRIADAVDPRDKKRLTSQKDLDVQKLDKEEKETNRYGNRFVEHIKEAVEQAGKLSEVFKEAMTTGDWGQAFSQYMGKILSNLGNSYIDKAGGAIGSVLGSLVKFSGGSLDKVTPSFYAGTLPSYSMGTLPSYKEGYDYPKTPQQDSREPYNSRLAVINEREIVLNAQDASLFKRYKQNVASNNSSTVTNNTNSSTINMNINTNSFGGNRRIEEIRQKKENRFTK